MQNDDIMLRVSLAQYDVMWEDKEVNLLNIKRIVASLAGQSDLLVLPEMCTTGFTLNVKPLAETIQDNTIVSISAWAKEYDIAIVGSYIAVEDGKYFNRGFFITPQDHYYYDKHHLFRMGEEAKSYSSGCNKLIARYKGFNVCLQICYDLRFPVWSRNVNNEYDLLIYVASWPQSREEAWNILLKARAVENMSYVCGVNRIGIDGSNLKYNGNSKLIDPKGQEITSMEKDKFQLETVSISKNVLENFRLKFPVWKDADLFELKK